MSSVAKLFVAQMQDYLGWGRDTAPTSRGLSPATGSGGCCREADAGLAQRIRKLTRIYGRLA